MNDTKDTASAEHIEPDVWTWGKYQGHAMAKIGPHLIAHPHLPPVEIDATVSVQIVEDVSGQGRWVAGAHGALLWAKTMRVSRIVMRRTYDGRVRILVHGSPYTIGATEDGDLLRLCPADGWTDITLAQLSAYVAAGTVEHAGELVAR